MTGANADLQDYYENEAKRRLRKPPRGRRVELRTRFLARLRTEGCGSVLELGAGPGLDGEAFQAAGHRFLGVDLAHGNGLLAADTGVRVIQASVTALPVVPSSFDAGWSISTLMHLDEHGTALAAEEMIRALRPTAPLVVGMWGCEAEADLVDETNIPGTRRTFHLRTIEHNRRLLTAGAELDEMERWEQPSEDWDYQVFHLRAPA